MSKDRSLAEDRRAALSLSRHNSPSPPALPEILTSTTPGALPCSSLLTRRQDDVRAASVVGCSHLRRENIPVSRTRLCAAAIDSREVG